MIQITGRATAEPKRIELGDKTTVSLIAQSLKRGGEDGVIEYDLGRNSDVVFEGGLTIIREDIFVEDSDTQIEREFALDWKDGATRRKKLITIRATVASDKQPAPDKTSVVITVS